MTQIDTTQIRALILPAFVDAEVPAGAQDGTNATWTLANSPNPPTSLHVYFNGLRQNPSGTAPDYSISGNTLKALTFAPNLANGDTFFVDYRH